MMMMMMMMMMMIKVNFTLEQAMKAQSGSTGVVILFFNLGPRWGWVGG
jgi:hypothetical protein